MNKHFLPIKESLNDIIQRKRVQSGISIDDLIEKITMHDIKMSKKTYDRIENGNLYPTLEQFFIILKVLNCEVTINNEKIL